MCQICFSVFGAFREAIFSKKKAFKEKETLKDTLESPAVEGRNERKKFIKPRFSRSPSTLFISLKCNARCVSIRTNGKSLKWLS